MQVGGVLRSEKIARSAARLRKFLLENGRTRWAVSLSVQMVRVVTVRTHGRFLLDRLTFCTGARELFLESNRFF